MSRLTGIIVVCAVALGGCAMAPQSAGKMPALSAADAPQPTLLAAVVAPADGSPAAAAAARPDAQRLMIYSAALRMTVPDLRQVQESIRQLAVSAGGYLQEMDSGSITVRVPAAGFERLVQAVERLGEVTSRHMKAADITEEMRDLNIRLSNAEQTRKQLLALLEKSQKVEDALKIEQELQRVTETIELLKGKIRYLESQVAFSTLRVELNSPLPQTQTLARIPFPWVQALADGLVSGKVQPYPDARRGRQRGVQMDLPASYIRFYDREGHTEAMSAEGVLIRVRQQDNYDGGDMAFWSALCRRALVENRAIALADSGDLAMRGDTPGRFFIGQRSSGGEAQGYLLVLAVTRNRVYTFEAWGPQSVLTADLGALKKSAASMRLAG